MASGSTSSCELAEVLRLLDCGAQPGGERCRVPTPAGVHLGVPECGVGESGRNGTHVVLLELAGDRGELAGQPDPDGAGGRVEERHRHGGHRLGEELVGARPVPVDGRATDPGMLGDLLVRHRRRPVSEQEFASRVENDLTAAEEARVVVGAHDPKSMRRLDS